MSNRRLGLALGALLGLAAANFGLQLGSSSYFVDEVLSVEVSAHPLATLMHAISHVEITPPGYFLFQHEWMARLGSEAEWLTRLPSAVCGVGLVAAVYWLASMVTRRREVALGAAGLAALSPFLLQYSQRAQGYIPAALLVTLSVCAVLSALSGGRHPRAWLWVGGVLAAVALCVNYTAAIPVAMLCVWVLLVQGELSLRRRVLFVCGCAAVGLALLPLFIVQWRNTPGRVGVGEAAGISPLNLGRMARLPFYAPAAPLAAMGIVVTMGAIAALALRWRRLAAPLRLVLAIAVGEPVILLLLSAFGARVAFVRYAVVASPFVIVAVTAGLMQLPAVLAGAGAVAILVVCGAGLAAGHQQSGFYADARGAVDFIQAHRLPTDAVLSPVPGFYAVPLAYYGSRRLRPVLPYAFVGTSKARGLVSQRRRVWVVSPVKSDSVTARRVAALQRRLAARIRYRVPLTRVLPSLNPLAVTLWSPIGHER